MALPPIDDADYAWFRKTFNGLFWKPVSIEGWIVTGIWFFSNIWYLREIDWSARGFTHALTDAGFFLIISTLVLLFIVYHSRGRRWE